MPNTRLGVLVNRHLPDSSLNWTDWGYNSATKLPSTINSRQRVIMRYNSWKTRVNSGRQWVNWSWREHRLHDQTSEDSYTIWRRIRYYLVFVWIKNLSISAESAVRINVRAHHWCSWEHWTIRKGKVEEYSRIIMRHDIWITMWLASEHDPAFEPFCLEVWKSFRFLLTQLATVNHSLPSVPLDSDPIYSLVSHLRALYITWMNNSHRSYF